MNKSTSSFLAIVQEITQSLLGLTAWLLRWLPQASLSRIFLMCIGLAVVAAALPFAIVLFVLFLIVKLIIGHPKEPALLPGPIAENEK